jgi:outer membrane protein assembly factor BamB
VNHRHAAPARSTQALVLVTVVDGDTHARIRTAHVRIGPYAAHADGHGVAWIRILPRASLPVSASAPGYSARTVRESFRLYRQVTIRLFQPRLQWTMYGASPARVQAQDWPNLRPPFRIVWTRGLDSLLEFPAVVSDGIAYVGNSQGTIDALSMANGDLLWRHVTPGGKMASSPAVWGGLLVVHGMDGHVWVLDLRTGRLRWFFSVGSPVESSPLVQAGVDFFGAWDGTVYALDLRTHRLRWSYAGGYKITSSAAIAGATLYIGDYGGRLIALSPASGRLRWSVSVNGRIYGTPAVMGGRVFVPSSDGGSLTAFSTGGRYLWRILTGAYVYSSPAASAGRVFFGSYNGVFYGVSAASGRVLWSVGTGGAISGAAVVVGGVAYAGSFSHSIYGVDVRSGRVLLRFPHGEYVPVSGNGERLLLHGYSRLWAVAPR